VKYLRQGIYKQWCYKVPSCPPHYDTSQTPGVYLGLYAGDTCIYAMGRKEGYVLRKLQRGLSAIETWCESWNMKFNEDKTQTSRKLTSPETHLTWNGRNIPFVNHVKYLGAIFDKRITWRLHIEMIKVNFLRTFTEDYSLFSLLH
jgi:hypothetical protein